MFFGHGYDIGNHLRGNVMKDNKKSVKNVLDLVFNNRGEDEIEGVLEEEDEDFDESLFEMHPYPNDAPQLNDINELPTPEPSLKCEAYQVEKLKPGEVPLGRVIGHENQKKELLSVIDWFNRSSELKARGVSIPKGVILFGHPGNGKSLLIKEIIRCVDAPVYVFQGEQTNVVGGIVEVFKQAREAGHSIIVIDELDLLINKERRVVRALQENLDGVESNDDILVLAATNNIEDIPDPLLRNGRLEKLIRVPDPNGKEAVQLFKMYIDMFKVELPQDFDEEEMEVLLNRVPCSSIKAIVNDIVLRNGFENITSKMIDDSVFNVAARVKDAAEEDNIEVSVHEAGHACMAHAYPEYFMINRLNISGASGEFHAKEVTEGFWPYDKIIADIHILMAGVLAQKVIYGRGSRGCEDDLERARITAYNCINKIGYSSCWETLPTTRPGARIETQAKRRKMERKIERLLKKCEKETVKYIKKNKKKIMQLAELLYEKKHLKSSEILSVIG